MRPLWKTTLVEGKLFLREPLAVVFGILFPAAIMLALDRKSVV